jgi:hypothetical protein
MRNTGLIVFVVPLLMVATSLLRAEDEPKVGTGTIVGLVLDVNGKPAADVLIVAQQSAQKMRLGLDGVTDKEGKFKIEKAPEGDYNLKIRTRDGKFKALTSAGVTADKTTDVGKIKLKPA